MNIWMLLKKIAASLARGEEGNEFYINGPDTLPPPLSPEREAEMIELIRRHVHQFLLAYRPATPEA